MILSMATNNSAHNALTELWFHLTDTGGGVEQFTWFHEPSGRYRIISTTNGEVPTSMDEPVMVCDYDDGGQTIGEPVTYSTLTEALSHEERPS